MLVIIVKRKRTDSSILFEILKQIRNAIFNDDSDTLKELLSHISDINHLFLFESQTFFVIDSQSKTKPSYPCEQYTLLHIAAILGRVKCVELILNIEGVDPDIYSIKIDKNHLTPAHSIYYGITDELSDHASVMELILEKGASLDSEAVINGTAITVKELFQNGAPAPSTPNSKFFKYVVPVAVKSLVTRVLGIIEEYDKKPASVGRALRPTLPNA